MIQRIGRYEIETELGSGGFGQVFRAYDPTVGRQVALKILKAGAEPELFRRFRNEAAAAGKLRHQNIVIVYDFGEQDGTPYLVMELLDGEDLDRVIANRRPLKLAQKLDVMVQAAAGLHHAHANGIVHRDVKPANIMLLRDGVVKIMDFGIALLTQATAARLTRKGDLLGTFAYMAPEHFSATPSSDALSDIFAYGTTCYKLLTGIHPFEPAQTNAEIAALIYNVMNKTPAPLREFDPECPEALEQIVFKLLAKDRDSRYQSLEDVRFDLEPIILDLRRDSVSELLREVQGLIADDRLEAAQTSLRQALDLDPANRGARELREKLQRLIREKALRPQIDALISAGQQKLEARHFDDAIQKFESALRLDKSNPAIHAHIEQARQSWEKAQRADRLVKEASSALDGGDLAGAQENLEEALALDSQHTLGAQLISHVRQKIEARERDRWLRDGLSQVQRLMLLKSFPEAIAALRKIQAEYPESPEVVQLLERAREGQEALNRRKRLQSVTEEAQGLLKRRDFAEAAERLLQWKVEFPESAELPELYSYAEEELRAQKQAEEVARAAAEARRSLEQGEFDSALERLRSALSEHPGASELRDLVQSASSAKAEHQRNAALNLTLHETNARVVEERFVEALDRIASFVRAYGESARLEPLRKQAETGLEQQRRLAAIRKLVGDAQGLLEQGRAESATQLLRQGNVQFPDDPNVTQLLNVAEGRLREQQRSNALSKMVSEAENLARAYQFERAIELLNEGLRQYPGEQRLERCREAVITARATHERDQLRQKVLEDAQRLRSAGKLSQALETINAAHTKTGEDAVLLDLKRQIDADWSAQLRTEELQRVMTQAQALLSNGQFEAAEQLLRDAAKRYPNEEKIAGLKDVAANRLREQQRGKAIEQALQYAEEERRAKRFDDAIRMLDAAIEQQGAEEALRRARESVVTEKLAAQRERSLAEVRMQARGLQSAGRLSDAIRKIEGALQFLGEDGELSELKRQIELEQEAQRRAAAVRDALRQAQDHLDRKQASQARQVLQTALSEYSGEGKLTELLEVADARLRDEQRELAIAGIVQQALQLASEKRFVEALRGVDDGLQLFPGDPRLSQSRESVLQTQGRAESLAQARRLHEQNNIDAALQVLVDALKVPAAGDSELLDLKNRIESDREKQRRSAAIGKVLEQAQVLARDGRLEDAIASLGAAARQYPDETQISALLRTCEENLRRQQRERELQRVQDQATALLKEGKQEETIALLEGQYSHEPRFRELLVRAREELRTRKRNELLLRTGVLRQEARHQDALKTVTQAIQRYGSTPAAIELQQDLRNTIEQQQRWEARQRNYERLLTIDRQVTAESRRRKLKALRAEAQRIATAYAADAEISQVVTRIDAAVGSALTVSSTRKQLPWKTVAAAGAAFAIAGGLFLTRMLQKKRIPSEIRTDPLGATVQVGERSCTTPNCRFDLPPGLYQVQARLEGYESAQGTLVADPGRHLGLLNLTLKPMPPPVVPGQVNPKLGTLVVQVGTPAAQVFIDNVSSGLTDAQGNFSLSIEAKTHAVRVEKTGYQTPSEQRAKLAEGATQKVIFNLAPQPREVATSKESPLSPTSQLPNPQPPTPTRPQPTSSQQPQQPTLPITSTTPAPPDPEARDWEQLRRTDPSQLQAFLEKYPNSPHTPEAQVLLDNLLWKATNQNDLDSLRAYLKRLPKGAHSSEASLRVMELVWAQVDKKSAQALRSFLQQNSDNSHRQEAESALDQLEKLEAMRSEQERQQQSQQQAIRLVLEQFNAAFEHKKLSELKQIWPAAPSLYQESIRTRASFAMLHPSGSAEISGNTASIDCTLITQNTVQVKVILQKNRDQWFIDKITTR